MEQRSHSLEEIIEESKSHWSQVGESNSNNKVSEVSNMELFKTLQGHPAWGTFFKTFGEGEGSSGDMVMGKKFGEGGQVEIYEVQIKWDNPIARELLQNIKLEFVLKVFKKGTFLQHLQSQWPQGMLQDHGNKQNHLKLGLHPRIKFQCEVICRTLLEDGRFAFVMVKEQGDLWSMIDRRMLKKSNDEGSFSKREVLETMYFVAFGMDQLHNSGIVHSDLKASNVLLSNTLISYLANFECSVGVVGIGNWVLEST